MSECTHNVDVLESLEEAQELVQLCTGSDADAVHTGVKLDLHVCDLALLCSFGIDCGGIFLCIYNGLDSVLDSVGQVIGGYAAQNQQGDVNAVLAQLDGLIDHSYSNKIRTQRNESLGGFYVTKTVSISLEDRYDFFLGTYLLLDLFVVFA